MTLYNPNRFVTGLTDIHYVKQVNRKTTYRDPNTVPVSSDSTKPIVVRERPTIDTKFIPDPFKPEDASEL
jgi:hypothetical protein